MMRKRTTATMLALVTTLCLCLCPGLALAAPGDVTAASGAFTTSGISAVAQAVNATIAQLGVQADDDEPFDLSADELVYLVIEPEPGIQDEPPEIPQVVPVEDAGSKLFDKEHSRASYRGDASPWLPLGGLYALDEEGETYLLKATWDQLKCAKPVPTEGGCVNLTLEPAEGTTALKGAFIFECALFPAPLSEISSGEELGEEADPPNSSALSISASVNGGAWVELGQSAQLPSIEYSGSAVNVDLKLHYSFYDDEAQLVKASDRYLDEDSDYTLRYEIEPFAGDSDVVPDYGVIEAGKYRIRIKGEGFFSEQAYVYFEIEQAEPKLEVSPSSLELYLGDDEAESGEAGANDSRLGVLKVTYNGLDYTGGDDLDVSVSIDDESIASVGNFDAEAGGFVVTGIKQGRTTATVSVAATADYKAATQTVSIVVGDDAVKRLNHVLTDIETRFLTLKVVDDLDEVAPGAECIKGMVVPEASPLTTREFWDACEHDVQEAREYLKGEYTDEKLMDILNDMRDYYLPKIEKILDECMTVGSSIDAELEGFNIALEQGRSDLQSVKISKDDADDLGKFDIYGVEIWGNEKWLTQAQYNEVKEGLELAESVVEDAPNHSLNWLRDERKTLDAKIAIIQSAQNGKYGAVTVPVANRELVYTGSELPGVRCVVDDDSERIAFEGVTKETNAGSYVAYAKLKVVTDSDPKHYYYWKGTDSDDREDREVKEIKWSIAPAPISSAQVKLEFDRTSLPESGEVVAPKVESVTFNGLNLEEGADYTVTYPSAIDKVGTYTITIAAVEGKNFTGTQEVQFQVTDLSDDEVESLRAVETSISDALPDGFEVVDEGTRAKAVEAKKSFDSLNAAQKAQMTPAVKARYDAAIASLEEYDREKAAAQAGQGGAGGAGGAAGATGEGVADGEEAVVGGATYLVESNARSAVIYQKAPKSKSKVTIPAKITIKGKSYDVIGIASKAFKGTKAKTVTIKTTKLTKKAVKGSLKSAKKLKIIKVKVGSKKANKKYVKRYKKYFKKSNSGKKVTVK